MRHHGHHLSDLLSTGASLLIVTHLSSCASPLHLYVHVYSVTVSTRGEVLHEWHMREAAGE